MTPRYHHSKSIVTLTLAGVLFISLTACARENGQSYNNNIHIDYKTQRKGGDYTHFRTQTFEYCIEECANDRRCQSFDFNITNNSCWLKDRIPPSRPSEVIASGVKQRDYDAGGANPPYPPADYYPDRPEKVNGVLITRNIKRNGGDYTNFTVRNMKECARACARDYNCQSFNYGKQKRDCWLKNNVPSGFSNNTVISGYKDNRDSDGYRPPPPGDYYPPKQPDSIAGLEITRNIKRDGGDYTNFTVRNMKECARACSRDYNCQSFNFGKQRKDCWLKNTVPAGFSDNTVISGFKKR